MKLNNFYPQQTLLTGLTFYLLFGSCVSVMSKQVETAPQQERVWRFEQKYIYGKQTTSVCKKGLRIELTQIHCCLLAKAPKWDVYFFNFHNKLAVILPFKDYLAHTILYTHYPNKKGPGKQWPVLFAGTQKYANATVQRFVFPANPYQKSFTPDEAYIGRFLVFDLPEMPEEALAIAAKFFGVNQTCGVPVCTESMNKGKSNPLLPVENLNYYSALETSSIVSTAVSSNIFDCPKELTKVSKEIEVCQQDDDEDVKALLENFVDSKKPK